MTVFIKYERVSPAVLANTLERYYGASVFYEDVNEDYFSLTFFGCFFGSLDEMLDYLAEYEFERLFKKQLTK